MALSVHRAPAARARARRPEQLRGSEAHARARRGRREDDRARRRHRRDRRQGGGHRGRARDEDARVEQTRDDDGEVGGGAIAARPPREERLRLRALPSERGDATLDRRGRAGEDEEDRVPHKHRARGRRVRRGPRGRAEEGNHRRRRVGRARDGAAAGGLAAVHAPERDPDAAHRVEARGDEAAAHGHGRGEHRRVLGREARERRQSVGAVAARVGISRRCVVVTKSRRRRVRNPRANTSRETSRRVAGFVRLSVTSFRARLAPRGDDAGRDDAARSAGESLSPADPRRDERPFPGRLISIPPSSPSPARARGTTPRPGRRPCAPRDAPPSSSSPYRWPSGATSPRRRRGRRRTRSSPPRTRTPSSPPPPPPPPTRLRSPRPRFRSSSSASPR
eukprot:31089-Pelagococcus_subviridis.AAC.9